jgi:hypothetical protein
MASEWEGKFPGNNDDVLERMRRRWIKAEDNSY